MLGMNYFDIFLPKLQIYSRMISPDDIRRAVYLGDVGHQVRLDFLFSGEAFYYSESDVRFLHRDLIEEMSKVIEKSDHQIEIDGYPFINVIHRDKLEICIEGIEREMKTYHLEIDQFLRDLIYCLRVTECICDALYISN